MIRELYLYKLVGGVKTNYTQIDIAEVDIVRQYTSPYFSDITQIKNNGTYTIKLPKTATNKAFFEHCDREDMATDIPYDYLYADYFVNALTIFESAQVIVLDTIEFFEIQCVWGLLKEKYSPLFEDKLNTITPNGTNILETEWVSNWNSHLNDTDCKFKYIDYISGERTSDVIILNNTTPQAKIDPPAPFDIQAKQMTVHPFIAFENILDAIIFDHNTKYPEKVLPETLFDDLKPRLRDKGLILGGAKDNFTESFSHNYSISTTLSTALLIGSNIGGGGVSSGILEVNGVIFSIYDSSKIYKSSDKTTIKVEYDFYISNNITGLQLYKGTELIRLIPYISNNAGYLHYKGSIEVEDDGKIGGYLFKFQAGSTSATYQAGGYINFSVKRDIAVYSLYGDIYTGRYNCLYNLPDITKSDFLQQMLILSGMVASHDSAGDLVFKSYDQLKAAGVADWSDKVANPQKGYFKLGVNAQSNYIKYANWDKVNYENKGLISVSNKTLELEKDLFKFTFDLGNEGSNNRTEFILYTQDVTTDGQTPETKTFKQTYSEKNDIAVSNKNGMAVNFEVVGTDSLAVKTGMFYINPIIDTFNFDVLSSPNYNTFILSEISTFDTIAVGFKVYRAGNVFFSEPLATITSLNSITGEVVLSSDPGVIVGEKLYFIPPTLAISKFTIQDYSDELGFLPDVGSEITFIDGVAQTDLLISSVDYTNPLNPIFTLNSAALSDINEHLFTILINVYGFISRYYSVYKNVVERPIIREVDVNLSFYESANIDFTKPVYVPGWGKYCMLLELTAPDNEVCTAKLLLIDQEL